MYRILFLMVVWIGGNSVMGQNFRADSLLQKISADPANQTVYLNELLKEYETLREIDLITYQKKSIQAVDDRESDVHNDILAFRTLGSFFWSKTMYSEALNLYDKSIAAAIKDDLPSEAGNSYFQVAGRFMESQMFPQALERVYKANQYFITAQDRLKQAATHSMGAAIGFRAQNFLIAVEEIEKSLNLYRSIDASTFTHSDSLEMMSALNTCGLAYAGLRKEENAIACYAEAEKFASLLKNKFWVGLINGNKASIYAARGELDIAISSLEIDLHHSLEANQAGSAISSCIYLSDLHIEKNDWAKAIYYFNQVTALIKKNGYTRLQESKYLKVKSQILEHSGDLRGAYRVLQRHQQVSDSIEIQQRSSGLISITTAHEIQLKENEIETLTAENKIQEQQVTYRNIIVGVAALTIFLFVFLGLVILRNYKRKKKDNQLLVSRNEEIKSINEELHSYTEALSNQNQVIQEMNDDLELRVKKRTRELEETNSELDMFLYRASHDIRRPITTLLGLGNLAQMSLRDPASIEMFDQVSQTAYHMDRMLHKLQMVYAMNRPIGSGATIPLQKAIQNSVDKFSTEMKKVGMDYTLHINDSITVEGDESLYSIIFQNLIENAITFRKSDELEKPHLIFETTQLDEHVIVKISDNGIGIEHDYIEKIFDLHFRGTALSRGNGLGLYLVKKALTLLKGRIEVDSEYGVGSNFIIYFPRNIQKM